MLGMFLRHSVGRTRHGNEPDYHQTDVVRHCY